MSSVAKPTAGSFLDEMVYQLLAMGVNPAGRISDAVLSQRLAEIETLNAQRSCKPCD
jgi:hypothetical protein